MVNVSENKELAEKLDRFSAKCRQAGLKVTPQRTAIYKSLITTTSHPSADMVYRTVRGTLENISFDTVNRTLLTFSKIGAAFVVEGSGEVRRFDANFESHQHFKCVKCKSIIDFKHEPFDKVEVPAEVGDKFKVLRKTVYFEGLCDKCK
jgi:Fur family peroxide stress response transcriptional regulator